MLDNKGRIFGKVSLVDIVIVLLIVVLGGGFAYRQMSERLNQIMNPSDLMYVTIKESGVRHFLLDAVAVGDVMFRHLDRHALGTVVDIEVLPAMDFLHRHDGTVVLAEMEQRYTVVITLAAIGTINETGYFVNGVDHIAPGSEISLISNRVLFPEAVVYSVERRG